MVSVRRERLKHELREEILAAARDLFVREGFESVSMRGIAERVGCAPGTLYLYFEDKNSILAAICEETFAKLNKRMEAIRNDKGEPLERLRRGGRTYVQFGLDHPDHYLVTFGSKQTGPIATDSARQAGRRSFECLHDCVRMALEEGALRFDDADAVAQSLWASMHGIVMLLITKCAFPFVEQSRLIETALDIAIEGVRKR